MDRANLLCAAAADASEAILLYYNWIVLAGCYRMRNADVRTPTAIDRRCPCKAAVAGCLRVVLSCKERAGCVPP